MNLNLDKQLNTLIIGDMMKVSAILPVYNNKNTLIQCIESLLNQSKPFDEIIVVDDKSTDSSKEIIKKFKVKLIALEKNKGRSAARNTGFRESKNEIVFFAESDAKYSENFNETCVKHFSDSKVGGVIGKLEVWNKDKSPWTKCRAAELNSRFSEYVPFTGWMYRRKIIEKIGGFRGDVDIGEDTLLGKEVTKAGYTIEYEKKAVWKHTEQERLTKTWKASWIRGKGLAKQYKYAGIPKIVFVDAAVLFSVFLSLIFNFLEIIFLVFMLAQLFVRRKQFLFIEKKYWGHLLFYLLTNIILFKIARLFGVTKELVK